MREQIVGAPRTINGGPASIQITEREGSINLNLRSVGHHLLRGGYSLSIDVKEGRASYQSTDLKMQFEVPVGKPTLDSLHSGAVPETLSGIVSLLKSIEKDVGVARARMFIPPIPGTSFDTGIITSSPLDREHGMFGSAIADLGQMIKKQETERAKLMALRGVDAGA